MPIPNQANQIGEFDFNPATTVHLKKETDEFLLANDADLDADIREYDFKDRNEFYYRSSDDL